MKKYLFLLLSVPLLFSCAEKVKTCKIVSSSVGTSLRTYSYNGNQLQSYSDWTNSGQTLGSYCLFSYSDQGIQMDRYTNGGQLQYRYNALYNTNEKIGSVTILYDGNTDGYPEVQQTYAQIFYQSDKPDSIGIYVYQNATILSYKYHWTGDNLTSFQFFVDGVLNGTSVITYDDSPNPYYSMQQPVMMTLYNDNPPYMFSKNAVTHFLYYDEIAMAYTFDDTYTNTIDSDGNLGSNGIYNFAYQCEEK